MILVTELNDGLTRIDSNMGNPNEENPNGNNSGRNQPPIMAANPSHHPASVDSTHPSSSASVGVTSETSHVATRRNQPRL